MAYPASSSLSALGNVYQAADGSFTETFVIPASPPYTHMIGAASPYNYPSGWQIIPSTGVSNAVTITGAAHASWTSVPSAPIAGQFVYDTSISPTGGTLTFAAGDAGATVTATWIGSTDVNKALMQALVTALHDIAVAAGAPSGLATLDANTHLVPTATSGPLTVNGLLQSGATGTGVTVAPFATGMGSGGSYTAPVVQAGSTPQRGRVSFATGTAPQADAQLMTVSLGATFPNGAIVVAQPVWQAANGATVGDAGCWPQHNGLGTPLSSFNLNVKNALLPNTIYYIDYWVIG